MTASEVTWRRPDPPHSGQGSATTRPDPPHSGHTIWNMPPPNKNDMSTPMAPVPPQLGQVWECSDETEPEPWQWSQGSYRRYLTPLRAPS